jgi:cytochrome c-type biogenesis protein CcmH/NrfG
MGRWDVARPALEEALRLSEQTQGPNHPDIAETLCLLARVEAHDGNVDRAEAFYRRALRITADPEGQGARASAEEGLREIGR